MSSAARCDRDVPPEPPRDLPAEAAELVDRAAAAVLAVGDDPRDERAVSELAFIGIRLAQVADALRGTTADLSALARAYAAGVAAEQARAAAARTVPARRERRAPPLRRPVLSVVPA